MNPALLLCTLAAGFQQPAQTACALPTPGSLRAAPSFEKSERVVATEYFYWYRFPGEHLDQLTLHFPDEQAVSYESVAWHTSQLEDMRAAGIDVCLPVYWGALGNYEKSDVAFSVRGLPALVAAADELERKGVRAPRIGMFYDTSTLLDDVRGAQPSGARADLRTPQGRALFYGTIRDFFCQVPPRLWAQIDGQPLVVLYSSGFASGYDQLAFDELAACFARDFGGKQPCVVRERSWTGVRTQASYAWGAALNGVQLGEGTVALGPGYDDSAVLGRTTPVRQREAGRFYEKSWRTALRSPAALALVETWNEMHEGTSIARTREFGAQYIELTARYAQLFRRRATLEGEIELEFQDPVPRRDDSWGASSAGARAIEWRAGSALVGLRPIAWEDGALAHSDAPPELVARGSCLYFQVADAFAFDVDADFELELEFLDRGRAALGVEYDSRDAAATLRGAYTRAPSIERGDTGQWRTARVKLAHARFSNRENGAADLRLVTSGAELNLRALRLAPSSP